MTPDGLWAEFSAAVSRQAAGYRRIGVSLGGLDSSGILAAAVEERGSDGVIAFSYRGVDDDPFVDELCRHLRVQCVPLDWGEAMERIEQALIVDGEPSGSAFAALSLQIANAAKSHNVDLILSGAPGDDIMGGELELFDAEIRRRPLQVLPVLLSARFPRPYSSARRLWRWVLTPMLRRTLPRVLRIERARNWLGRRMPWLSPRTRELFDPRLGELVDASRAPTTPLDVYEKRATSPDYRRWARERAHLIRECGVQHREPFLDSRLVALLSAVPIAEHFSGGTFRGLFRAAMGNRVPDCVRERLGKVQWGEVERRYRPKVETKLRHLVPVQSLSRDGVVCARRFREAFERLGPFDWDVWRTLAAEAYLQRGASGDA